MNVRFAQWICNRSRVLAENNRFDKERKNVVNLLNLYFCTILRLRISLSPTLIHIFKIKLIQLLPWTLRTLATSIRWKTNIWLIWVCKWKNHMIQYLRKTVRFLKDYLIIISSYIYHEELCHKEKVVSHSCFEIKWELKSDFVCHCVLSENLYTR